MLGESSAQALLLVLAVLTATLPFVNERLFAVIPVSAWQAAGIKPFWARLFELLAFYLLVGAVGFALEGRFGNRFAQGWAFYAITGSIYLVCAYPGFVWRYLWRRRVRRDSA